MLMNVAARRVPVMDVLFDKVERFCSDLPRQREPSRNGIDCDHASGPGRNALRIAICPTGPGSKPRSYFPA